MSIELGKYSKSMWATLIKKTVYFTYSIYYTNLEQLFMFVVLLVPRWYIIFHLLKSLVEFYFNAKSVSRHVALIQTLDFASLCAEICTVRLVIQTKYTNIRLYYKVLHYFLTESKSVDSLFYINHTILPLF